MATLRNTKTKNNPPDEGWTVPSRNHPAASRGGSWETTYQRLEDIAITVTSKQEAWNKVNEIFPTEYEQDQGSSDRAGYPIYRSTAEGHYYDYICDLGNRLEVNLDSSHLATVNIWIEQANTEQLPELSAERREVAKRLQRITFYYTEEYSGDEQQGQRGRSN